MARIAVDAMGGDHAPHAPIAGALHALASLPAEHQIILVGRTEVIEAELAAQLPPEAPGASVRDRLAIVDAPEVITMTDKPGIALRGKPQSSMVVGVRLVADGRADAFVSAGNTGAQMAASTVILKLQAGLKRPAIGTIFPTARQPVLVLDAGANVDCSAEELVHFARIGAVYAHDLMGRAEPVVGLLSIGEEPEKGNAAVKEAHQRLASSGLRFIGNVEGRDLPDGACDRGPFDVVVCDGFVGNVLLKFYERLAPTLIAMISRTAGLDEQGVARALTELDADEYGGAPLLGVDGVSIICHGRSTPRALANAVRVAVRAVESRMVEHVGRRLADSAERNSGHAA